MAQKVLNRVSGAGGYFAAPGSNPPKAGAFAPRKAVSPQSNLHPCSHLEDNIFAESQKEKTSIGTS